MKVTKQRFDYFSPSRIGSSLSTRKHTQVQFFQQVIFNGLHLSIYKDEYKII